jgi:hypothetical protein
MLVKGKFEIDEGVNEVFDEEINDNLLNNNN